MLATLNNIADWIVGLLAFFLIVFWLVLWPLGLIDPILSLFVRSSKLSDDKRSHQSHKATMRDAQNHGHVHRNSRLPTNRQLDYIDSLLEKREVEEWMRNYHPSTIEEASELIDDLLACPHIDGDYDCHNQPILDEQTQIQKSIDRNIRKKRRHNSPG